MAAQGPRRRRWARFPDPGRCAIGAETKTSQDDRREGIVIRATGGHCLVAVDGETWRCQVRGRLKKGPRESQTVAVVGDRVVIEIGDAAADPPTGVIAEVGERCSRISRMAARRSGGHIEQVLMANLDQVVAVQSLRDPAPQTGFVDRLLVAAERFGVAGVLVLNKTDLVADGELAAEEARWSYYEGLGYRVVWAAAASGRGVDDLREVLTDRISLLIGASGVGKSSLLNAIQPGLRLRVNEVTEKTGLGRHTTTRTELFPLRGGGFIADSPGIRGFDPWDMDILDVREHFPDFRDPSGACRFRSCLHRDEPDCGVKNAVALGEIPPWRHEAYLALLAGLEERQTRAGRRPGGRS
ncbi:ribosome small subunit-dependent GTPase A [bacterium]|nr:ribosome small subunit-dependent GTPase A [bacterium]